MASHIDHRADSPPIPRNPDTGAPLFERGDQYDAVYTAICRGEIILLNGPAAPGAVTWGQIQDLAATGPATLIPAPRRPVETGRVVYYVRRRDGLIKIGTTGNLPRRLAGLRRLFGDVELLAVEPGGHKRETERHRQFGKLRRWDLAAWEGTEWFRAGAPLTRHVGDLVGAA